MSPAVLVPAADDARDVLLLQRQVGAARQVGARRLEERHFARAVAQVRRQALQDAGAQRRAQVLVLAAEAVDDPQRRLLAEELRRHHLL